VTTSAEHRRRRILEIAQERGSVRVSDLAAELGVAPVTARRDVTALAGQGLLEHGYGVASWPEQLPPYLAVDAGRTRPADRVRRTLTLGMLVPTGAYYFAEMVRGAQEAATAVGARLLVGVSGYRRSEDDVQVAQLLAAGVDGLLLTPSADSGGSHVASERFGDLAVPTVLVERRTMPFVAPLDRVCSDHGYGVFLAVRHLVSLGHRRIALAAHRSPTGAGVRAGYLSALVALGLGVPPVPVIDTFSLQSNPVGFDAAADRLLTAILAHEVTAALIHNDVDAIMLGRRLRAAGVRVPEEFSIIAYDDEVAATADPPLTAVQPPKRAVGLTAARMLLGRVGATGQDDLTWSPWRQVDLLPRIRIRDSCRPA
jgi:DNA-binding LacI/PurR family transcriptional regulator